MEERGRNDERFGNYIQTILTKTDTLSMLANTENIEHLNEVKYEETLHCEKYRNMNTI